MFGIDDMAIALGLQVGSNLIGSLLSRPKRSEFDFDALARYLTQASNASASRQASGVMTRLQEGMGGRGIGGGASAQIAGQAEAEIRGASDEQLMGKLADLKLTEMGLKQQHQQMMSDWAGGLFGGIAEPVGAYAGYRFLSGQYDKLGDMLGGNAGGAQPWSYVDTTWLREPAGSGFDIAALQSAWNRGMRR